MAKKPDILRMYNVSVVGLSGTEKEKGAGAIGVGKSCFCNRFITPLADNYYTDHISVLGQTDFSGRVVNNDHFLFWGDTIKTSDNGEDLTFNVIEQTEFVDDSSFQPFRNSKMDPYVKRCAATKISSAEKLAYICKNQLGLELENEFEQKYLPDGKINIDGFICLFDVSKSQSRRIDLQVDFVSGILNNLMKTKKPIVLATSKHDEANDVFVKEAEKLISRRDYKNGITMVETSAHNNVNVELAFFTLAHLVDKSRGRIRVVPFVEATKARKEVLEAAKGAYRKLIRSHVRDHNDIWSMHKKQFMANADYIHFVELFGSDAAVAHFRQYIRKLQEDHLKSREEGFVQQIPSILLVMLPDLNTIGSRSWKSCQNLIRKNEEFNKHFVIIEDGTEWHESDYVDSQDKRVPFDLLSGEKALNFFKNHVNVLYEESRRLEMRKNFQQLLKENPHVLPGKTLAEVSIFFLGRECFDNLSDKDRADVFETHQRELRENAKSDFTELLHEYSPLFAKYVNETVTTEDLQNIMDELRDEERYKRLSRLEEDRKVMILNHLGFIQLPSLERCPFRDKCMEIHFDDVLTKKEHRPESWQQHSDWMLDSEDTRLNLVILGQENLSNELVGEIRAKCVDDEYRYNDQFFNLDYRPIDGDVSLPGNSFKTQQFIPHGCFCVYSSLSSLEYIQESLEKTLLSDLQSDRLPFQGLPIVIIFAYDSSINEKVRFSLQSKGKSLSNRLQCPFIDIPNAQFCLGNEKSHFHASQIHLALKALIESIRHRAGFISNPYESVDVAEPDIRIVMCLMCGDQYDAKMPVGPLLNHQCCYVTMDKEKYHSVTLETYLGDSKRKVEVVVTSYHGAFFQLDNVNHGYILVYSAKRKASLATLSGFVESLPGHVPVQILAVSEGGTGPNAFCSVDYIENQILDGRVLADRLKAHFMRTSSTFKQQTDVYTPFFKDVWDKKADTESGYPMSGDESGYYDCYSSIYENSPLDRRPPAVLPKHTYNRSVSLNEAPTRINGDQLYDDTAPLTLYNSQYHSDSEHDRASSVSPPIPDGYCTIPTTEISAYRKTQPNNMYSEVDQHYNVRPSQIRKMQNEGWAINSLYVPSNEGWKENYHYERSGQDDVNKKEQKINNQNIHPQRLNLNQYKIVTDKIENNMKSTGKLTAPLATPEPIEIGVDYAQVADAISNGDNDYALVQDALPPGSSIHRIRSKVKNQVDKPSDSDSEFSSLERRDQHEKWDRRPSPHKKKNYRQRKSDCDVIPLLTRDRLNVGFEFPNDLSKVRSNSPSEGSEGTGDEFQNGKKPKKRRSFRTKKKKTKTTESEFSLSPGTADTDTLIQNMGHSLDQVYEGEEVGSLNLSLKKLLRKNDLDKQRKKEEKEKKRQKEEERKRQKMQRKNKKMKNPPGLVKTGKSLDDYVQREQRLKPLFVEKCINYIEEAGLLSEGIYRIPGNKAHVDIITAKFAEDCNMDIKSLDIPVNAVATALKQFFNELNDPIIPSYLYDELIEAAGIPDKSGRLLALRGVLKKLPPVHYEVLKFLMTHINKVSQKSSENSMDCKNLAICWWPTLLRPEFASFEKMSIAVKHLEDIVRTIIEQYGFFFYNDAEV